MWDIIKHSNIHKMGVSEKKERSKIFLKIMPENIPNMMKSINLCIPIVQPSPSTINIGEPYTDLMKC